MLGAPRSTVYARRGRAPCAVRPGPAPLIGDTDLLQLIHLVLRSSPFAGEGYRKVRARLRREHGIQVSGKRVLRLLRQEGLLAPQRMRGRRKPRPHDGTIIPPGPTSAGAPTRPWPGPGATGGCGYLRAWTTTPPRRGRTWPRSVTASPPCSRSTTASLTAGASSARTSPAGSSCGMTGAPSTARPTSPGPWWRGWGDHRQSGVPG